MKLVNLIIFFADGNIKRKVIQTSFTLPKEDKLKDQILFENLLPGKIYPLYSYDIIGV